MFYQVITFIFKQKPDYVYKESDFTLVDDGTGPKITEWNLNNIQIPTPQDLVLLTEEEVEETKDICSEREKVKKILETEENQEFLVQLLMNAGIM